MSQPFQKFDTFVEDLAHGVHALDTDQLFVLLTPTAPSAADTEVDTTVSPYALLPSGALEIAAGNGYTQGGNLAAFVSDGQVAGLYALVLASPAVWTAGPAALPLFRYAVVYNATAGAPAARPVVGWFDYGTGIAPNAGETFTLTLDQTNGTLTLT